MYKFTCLNGRSDFIFPSVTCVYLPPPPLVTPIAPLLVMLAVVTSVTMLAVVPACHIRA